VPQKRVHASFLAICLLREPGQFGNCQALRPATGNVIVPVTMKFEIYQAWPQKFTHIYPILRQVISVSIYTIN
jgi:hypothetical protein